MTLTLSLTLTDLTHPGRALTPQALPLHGSHMNTDMKMQIIASYGAIAADDGGRTPMGETHTTHHVTPRHTQDFHVGPSLVWWRIPRLVTPWHVLPGIESRYGTRFSKPRVYPNPNRSYPGTATLKVQDPNPNLNPNPNEMPNPNRTWSCPGTATLKGKTCVDAVRAAIRAG